MEPTRASRRTGILVQADAIRVAILPQKSDGDPRVFAQLLSGTAPFVAPRRRMAISLALTWQEGKNAKLLQFQTSMF